MSKSEAAFRSLARLIPSPRQICFLSQKYFSFFKWATFGCILRFFSLKKYNSMGWESIYHTWKLSKNIISEILVLKMCYLVVFYHGYDLVSYPSVCGCYSDRTVLIAEMISGLMTAREMWEITVNMTEPKVAWEHSWREEHYTEPLAAAAEST